MAVLTTGEQKLLNKINEQIRSKGFARINTQDFIDKNISIPNFCFLNGFDYNHIGDSPYIRITFRESTHFCINCDD